MELSRNNSLPLSVVLMSILLGIYVDIKCINWILAYGFFSSEGGFMSFLYPIVVACIMILFLTTNIKKEVRFSKKTFLLAAYLILFYIFTILFIGSPRVSITFFSIFTITGLLLPNFVKIDSKCFLISVMLWPTIAIFKLDRVFQMTLDWKDAISMDSSYAFMTPIIATIVYLFSYYRSDYRWKKVFIIILSSINFIFFLKLFQHGSRGPLLAIFLTLVFFWVVQYSERKGGAVFNRKNIFVALLCIVLSILFMNAFLDFVFLIMDKFGINSIALEKIVRLSAEGDLSNGRNTLKDLAINGFWDSFLVGNGLDRFDANTGQAYPHNFVLQILYDGGLLLAFILLVPIIVNTIMKFKKCSKSQYIVQTFLLFSSVPYALLSQDLWENAVFWLFVGSLFSTTFINVTHDYEI